MGRHEHGVGPGESPEPLRQTVAEVGEGDAGAIRSGGVLDGMVAAGNDRELEAVGLEHGRCTGMLDVGAGANRANPGRVEVRERVEQRVGPEVERVVVGERDAVDAEVDERLRRPGRRAEVEDPPRCRLATRRDAALEVQDEEISFVHGLDDLGRKQRLRRLALEALGHATAEHRVACERELHCAKPCWP